MRRVAIFVSQYNVNEFKKLQKIKIMKALTTSQLIKALMKKGYSQHKPINLSFNKWNADCIIFVECENENSYLSMYKKIDNFWSKKITSYAKLNASDKKELVSLILA